MIFEYNGVPLQMVSLDRVLREPVYDPSNTDLLYIKWTIAATCVFSPNGWPHATATGGNRTPAAPAAPQVSLNTLKTAGGPGDPYSLLELARGTPPATQSGGTDTFNNNGPGLGGPVPGGPVASSGTIDHTSFGPGVPPPNFTPHPAGNPESVGYITDTELRTRLWLPRKKLKIGWPAHGPGGQTGWWLVAPADGRRVDPANGPFPLALDVVEMAGEGLTFGVHYQIAVHTPATKEDLLVLSHRWEMTHVHDDNHYLTRITDGVVVFNGAEVDASGVSPDWLRNQFFLPIPLGFRRYLEPVTESPDGLTIRYRIRDVDETVVFSPGDSGAAHMDIQESVEYVLPWGAVAIAGGVGKLQGTTAGRAVGVIGQIEGPWYNPSIRMK
jgi:hypothetical protein